MSQIFRYALDELNQNIEPIKGKHAWCKLCGLEVLSVIPEKRAKHWRHKAKEGCDPWWENITEWHLSWQNSFPEECREIICQDPVTQEKHRADIITKNGMVIEVQHSSINVDERQAREKYYLSIYGKMIWIVHIYDDQNCRRYSDFRITLDIADMIGGRKLSLTDLRGKFFERWAGSITASGVYVIFDYGNKDLLWLRKKTGEKYEFDIVSRKRLIEQNGGR